MSSGLEADRWTKDVVLLADDKMMNVLGEERAMYHWLYMPAVEDRRSERSGMKGREPRKKQREGESGGPSAVKFCFAAAPFVLSLFDFASM